MPGLGANPSTAGSSSLPVLSPDVLSCCHRSSLDHFCQQLTDSRVKSAQLTVPLFWSSTRHTAGVNDSAPVLKWIPIFGIKFGQKLVVLHLVFLFKSKRTLRIDISTKLEDSGGKNFIFSYSSEENGRGSSLL